MSLYASCHPRCRSEACQEDAALRAARPGGGAAGTVEARRSAATSTPELTGDSVFLPKPPFDVLALVRAFDLVLVLVAICRHDAPLCRDANGESGICPAAKASSVRAGAADTPVAWSVSARKVAAEHAARRAVTPIVAAGPGSTAP
jgi:hypothetical protein